MAKTYAEYLAENGASADEIKVLDVPAARKVYEAQVKAAEKADADLKAAQADAADKAAKVAAYDKWYQEVAEPTATQLKNERDVAKAEADAERARLKSLQEAGLVKLEEKKAETAAAAAGTPFDPKAHNLVTTDILKAVADREGDAIAIMADIAEEHRELGLPRMNVRELRKEAVAANKSVEELWMQRYDIPAKRAAKAAADKSAYEKKIADDAIAKYRSENENPLTRPATASSNPFTSVKKSGTDGGNVLPWQGSQSERSNERVNRALASAQQKGII